MKKVTLILVMFFLTGCTDTSKELVERTEIENEIQLIDKGELGGDQDDDEEDVI